MKIIIEIVLIAVILIVLIAVLLTSSAYRALVAYLQVRLCLLATYLFIYYLGFLIYWGEIIQNARTLTPFFLYAISGMAIVVLFVAWSFSEQARTKRV